MTQTEAERREAIARIVDPELDAHLENPKFAKCRALVSIAYAKADAILALPTPPAGEAVAWLVESPCFGEGLFRGLGHAKRQRDAWAKDPGVTIQPLYTTPPASPDLVEALKPFADVAECDIGSDETDADFFRPMINGFNRAPRLTVGHFRRALAALLKASQ